MGDCQWTFRSAVLLPRFQSLSLTYQQTARPSACESTRVFSTEEEEDCSSPPVGTYCIRDLTHVQSRVFNLLPLLVLVWRIPHRVGVLGLFGLLQAAGGTPKQKLLEFSFWGGPETHANTHIHEKHASSSRANHSSANVFAHVHFGSMLDVVPRGSLAAGKRSGGEGCDGVAKMLHHSRSLFLLRPTFLFRGGFSALYVGNGAMACGGGSDASAVCSRTERDSPRLIRQAREQQFFGFGRELEEVVIFVSGSIFPRDCMLCGREYDMWVACPPIRPNKSRVSDKRCGRRLPLAYAFRASDLPLRCGVGADRGTGH